MRILPALLVFCLPLAAQTAKVIPLSAADSAERKTLEDQRAAIELKIKSLDARIQKQYTTVLEGDKDSSGSYFGESLTTGVFGFSGITWGCVRTLSTDPAQEKAYQDCEQRQQSETAKNPPPPQHMYRIGWTNGFEYTEDFKYIVPRSTPSGNGNYGNGNCCTWTYGGLYNGMGCNNINTVSPAVGPVTGPLTPQYTTNPYYLGTLPVATPPSAVDLNVQPKYVFGTN